MRSLKNFFAYQRAQGRGVKLKLDDDKVKWIHKQIKLGRTQRDIAKELRVCQATITAVNQGHSWTDVKREDEA